MTSFTNLLSKAGKLISDNSPKILTAMAVTGVVSTTVLAVRATPEALRRIELAENAFYEDTKPIEKVKAAWKCYIPAAAVGSVTIACIIAGNSISTKRNAALASLWALTENSFREYQEKIVGVLGEQKEQKARDEIAQTRVDKNPIGQREILISGSGTVLMYDPITDRYFQNDLEAVRKAVNDTNQTILTHMGYVSQNEFYSAIGLPPVKYGYEEGWTVDNLLEIDYSATISEDNKPCVVMNYRLAPVRDYDSFHR